MRPRFGSVDGPSRAEPLRDCGGDSKGKQDSSSSKLRVQRKAIKYVLCLFIVAVVALWVYRPSSRDAEARAVVADTGTEATVATPERPPSPKVHRSAHRKVGEGQDGGATGEKGKDAAVLASEIKADQALLLRSKMMSQAQLEMVMNVMQHRRTVSSTSSKASPRGADKQRATGEELRRGSRCLGGGSLPVGGELMVDNLGGRFSSWVKQLGGDKGARYIHMAMTERLGNGSLVVMWQQAPLPVEGTQEQAIYFTVSKDQTPREWYPERKLVVPSQGALWSPVMHFQDGVLYVLYSESRDCIRPATANAPPRWFPGGDVKMTGSEDLLTWDKPVLVYSQDHDFGVPKVLANKMIVRSNGDWVLPFWREIPRGGKALTPGKCQSTAMRASAGVLVSKDKGKHWRALGEITHPLTWLIENTVVELGSDNSLLMLFRTWAGRIFKSSSTNGGKSWSVPMPAPGLPNPDAKIHVIRLHNSTDLMLAFNDHQKYADDGFTRFRTALRLAISQDHGATWTRVAQVDEIDTPGWQFHYPTVMQHGCNITVAYSRTYVASQEDNQEDNSLMDAGDKERPGIRIMSFDLGLLRKSGVAGAESSRR